MAFVYQETTSVQFDLARLRGKELQMQRSHNNMHFLPSRGSSSTPQLRSTAADDSGYS